MDPTGFGLAIISEARTLVTSMKNRVENYQNGPAIFQSLSNNVDRLARHIAEVEKLLRTFPNAIPSDISVIFDETFAAVRDSLEDANRVMEKFFSRAFGAGSSSMLGKLKSRAIRTIRATTLNTRMDDVETQIKEATIQLLQLTLALGNALKIQEHQDILLPKIENLAVVETEAEEFQPRINAPAVTETVDLDFDSRDAADNPYAPEGVLKQSVLSSDSSSIVTAAAGAMKSAFEVVGMAGVGKTVALQGLARDKDVHRRFPDGTLFMTLGQGATVETVLRELANILVRTGATAKVSIVKSSTSVREAVDMAAPWFEGKVCLFLIDDIWPTKTCKTGFLTDLRQLLRESPRSRMVISTRNIAIAQCAGSIVKFGARDPLGCISQNIFLAHALSGLPERISFQSVNAGVLKIHSICAGLPIALAVTGCAVAFLTNVYGNFEKACATYATRLEKKRSTLGDEDTVEGVSLNAGILLSLEFLEAEFIKWKMKRPQGFSQSITDLYTSLCVLENQAWIPLSVLGRLWQLDDDSSMDIVHLLCGMSLATVHVWRLSGECAEEEGIVLHDLQLDFCQRQALDTKSSSFWHERLLHGYLETSHQRISEEPNTEVSSTIARFTPREWWSKSVPQDGYIHPNLSRHLSFAGHWIELAGLLLDARWTELRGRIGGILAFTSDFEELRKCLASLKMSQGHEALVAVGRSFEDIFKVVRLSWARQANNWRAFQFQLCGRLLGSRSSDIIVDAYLRSVEANTPKPYLRPLNPLFPDVSAALLMEIPVEGRCDCVACSPCGRYIAAGAGSDIVVSCGSTGAILKRLQGHAELVTSIAFGAGSKTIVSASYDKKVIVWSWESSDAPVQILEGHNKYVLGIAVSSDENLLFSVSDDQTLRIWDTIRGTQIMGLIQSSIVYCVAISGDGRKIAMGFFDGTVKVLDGSTKDIIFEDAQAHDFAVECLSFSPNGSYLVSGSRDKILRVWNSQTWTSTRFQGHSGFVLNATFSPDGCHITSCSDDGTIRLGETVSGKCVGVSSRLNASLASVAFIQDAERIVSGSDDGIVRIWASRLCAESKDHSFISDDPVESVAICDDGLQIASASGHAVRLWDSRTGHCVGLPLKWETADSIEETDVAPSLFAVSFSPDARRVVTGSDAGIRIWDVKTRTQLGSTFGISEIGNDGHMDWVKCASFSSDGLRIISGSEDTTVRVWDIETKEQTGEALMKHSITVIFVSESADGNHIVSMDMSGRTVISEFSSEQYIWTSEHLIDDRNNADQYVTHGFHTFEN